MKLSEKLFGNWVIAAKRSLFMPVNRSVPDVVQKRKDWKGLTDRTLAGLHPAFYSKMQFFLSSCRLLFLGR